MYTAIDEEANEYAHKFCAEAERLWEGEKGHDSRLNMIGAQLLSLAYMGHGKDHQVLVFLAASVQIAPIRMSRKNRSKLCPMNSGAVWLILPGAFLTMQCKILHPFRPGVGKMACIWLTRLGLSRCSTRNRK